MSSRDNRPLRRSHCLRDVEIPLDGNQLDAVGKDPPPPIARGEGVDNHMLQSLEEDVNIHEPPPEQESSRPVEALTGNQRDRATTLITIVGEDISRTQVNNEEINELKMDNLRLSETMENMQKGAAYKWFKRLAPGSITLWRQFSEEFVSQHRASRDYVIPRISLDNIKQGETESLNSYIQRVNAEAAKVGRLSKDDHKMTIVAAVRPKSKLWNNMLKRELDDLEDFYERANMYILVEDVHANLGVGKDEQPKKL
uniref:Retrotransposon gag domain-containing protein n=1 Tax=Cannabis sativa TaxID=3483 RepID=A0A803PD14_CANSA